MKFLQALLGDMDPQRFLFLLIWAMVGVVISLLIYFTGRDKQSNPTKFNLWYWIRDNWKRILLNLLMIVVTLRFCKEVLGVDISEFVALLIGVSYDRLAEFLQNKKVLIGKTDPNNYVRP